MLPARLTAVCLALLALVPAAQAAKSAPANGPANLHGFLLRADEQIEKSSVSHRDVFPRTPAFAWNRVAGALRYQFQLATSSEFRENAIVYSETGLSTPVAAPTATLPWITGAMYARVRAISRGSTTKWSNYQFDMKPGDAPEPLAGCQGLANCQGGFLRWTPVEGADGYQIWFVDILPKPGKFETVRTNVLDEREFYTFHRDASWTGTLRWRIRALRYDRDGDKRKNALPAVGYGPWSPIYTSANPAVENGPIKLVGTVSDVVASGTSSAPAHELMPAFLFRGNEAIDGQQAELFRVYVFTDEQCLNRVYASPVIGGPAYAPRPFGPLALPTSAVAISDARSRYLGDGAEPTGYMFDGEALTGDGAPAEAKAAATPTTGVPADSDMDPSGTGSEAPTGPAQINVAASTNLGAPVDLWDNDWSEGGYYWTVIPVAPVAPDAFSTIVDIAGAPTGSKLLPVLDASGFAAGDVITIGSGSSAEPASISQITGSTITLASALLKSHVFGESVTRGGGGVQYRDLELPQEVCTPQYGRVARLAKTSETTLTTGGDLFASGLSPTGALTSGLRSKSFYGSPLVSWTPALGATAYEVQWSKTRNPFKPVPDSENAGALGTMTLGTSAVLPLTPGTWYYRVRGFDYSLPTNAQQMTWSDPARIVISKPKFKVVGATKKTKKRK